MRLCGRCTEVVLEGVGRMSVRCEQAVWRVWAGCLQCGQDVWRVWGGSLEGVGMVFSGLWRWGLSVGRGELCDGCGQAIWRGWEGCLVGVGMLSGGCREATWRV